MKIVVECVHGVDAGAGATRRSNANTDKRLVLADIGPHQQDRAQMIYSGKRHLRSPVLAGCVIGEVLLPKAVAGAALQAEIQGAR